MMISGRGAEAIASDRRWRFRGRSFKPSRKGFQGKRRAEGASETIAIASQVALGSDLACPSETISERISRLDQVNHTLGRVRNSFPGGVGRRPMKTNAGGSAPRTPPGPEMLARAKGVDTDPAFGRKPGERPIAEHLRLGVVNLDKPAGPTSHQVVAWLKKAIDVGKAGHGGTLDPQVTGVLPIAILDATRVIRTLLEAPKEYVCVLEVHRDTKPERITQVLKQFVGPIYQ